MGLSLHPPYAQYYSDNQDRDCDLRKHSPQAIYPAMPLRWISLALIAAILAAEGYLLFNRYFHGPLTFFDWSGRVMTLEEKEHLFEETRHVVTEFPATDVEFARIVRSALDPMTVCGIARLKNRSGIWGSWVIFHIGFPGDHPLLKETVLVPFGTLSLRWLFEGRISYRIGDVSREVTPQDRLKCEPTTCEKCDRYNWGSVEVID